MRECYGSIELQIRVVVLITMERQEKMVVSTHDILNGEGAKTFSTWMKKRGTTDKRATVSGDISDMVEESVIAEEYKIGNTPYYGQGEYFYEHLYLLLEELYHMVHAFYDYEKDELVLSPDEDEIYIDKETLRTYFLYYGIIK